MQAPPMLDALIDVAARIDVPELFDLPAAWHVDAHGTTHAQPRHDPHAVPVTGTLAGWMATRHCSVKACRSIQTVAGSDGAALANACQSILSVLVVVDEAVRRVDDGDLAAAVARYRRDRKTITSYLHNSSDRDGYGPLGAVATGLLEQLEALTADARTRLRSDAHRADITARCAAATASGPDGPLGDVRLLITGTRDHRVTWHTVQSYTHVDVTVASLPGILARVADSAPELLTQLDHPGVTAAARAILDTEPDIPLTDALTQAWRDVVHAASIDLPERIAATEQALLAETGTHLVLLPAVRQLDDLGAEVLAAFSVDDSALILASGAVRSWAASMHGSASVPVDPDAPGLREQVETVRVLISDGGVYADLADAWAAAGQLA